MDASRGHKRKISFADLEATFRRAGPMQHGPPQPQQQAQQPMSQQQMDQYRHEQARRLDLARRQSKKPTDREVPDELADVIVGDGVERYKKLRDVERRLDAVMMRKRLDISDASQRTHTRKEGVLRIWISNTAEGQPWQVAEEGAVSFGEDGTFDFGESSQATYRVKIEGKLLEEFNGPDNDRTEEEKKDDKARRPRLSHFFKSITIEFDRNPALQPNGYSAIEWKKPPTGSQNYDPNSSEVSFDTLEFERKSDENMNVTINLVREVKTERYKLSPQLAEILDTEEEDRAGVVQGIWEYCRVMGLQEDEDRRSVVCDEALRKVSFSFLQFHVIYTNIFAALQSRTDLLPTRPGPHNVAPPPTPTHPTSLHNPRGQPLHQRLSRHRSSHLTFSTNHLRHPRPAPQHHQRSVAQIPRQPLPYQRPANHRPHRRRARFASPEDPPD